jgi:asparagine synthase (glutamine-hydrolysing)
MGAIVAAIDKKGDNAVPSILTMLGKLTHRGADAHGIATQTLVETTLSLEGLKDTSLKASTAIGYNLSRILKNDVPQPVLGNGYSLVFDGRLFPTDKEAGLDKVINKLGGDPQGNIRRILKELDGAYAIVVSYEEKIIACRDAFGLVPLYYGENESTWGLASERKALWALGIRKVKSFPPGCMAVITPRGYKFKQVTKIVQPKVCSLNMEAASQRLERLLFEAMAERVEDVERVAVAFSGGLDSSVVALLAKMSGVDVALISVGLENQPEVKHAEAASKALGLALHAQTYNLKDVKENVGRVLWLVEEPNPMKVGVAIPFFWTAEIAAENECRVLLAGQGGDELFGGYQRYLSVLERGGVEALQKTLYIDVVTSYATNFERDHAVCAFHGVELRLPFIDRDVVNFALCLPLRLKIESAQDFLRKRVLRKVAKNLGIPSFIANRPKKAVQYATGVNRALRKLARSEGLTLTDYMKRLFREVYPHLEGLP